MMISEWLEEDQRRPTRATLVDALTRKYTVWRSFAEMIEDSKLSDYFPSLYPRKNKRSREAWELRQLADAYDAAMQARGDARRAWRGSHS